MDTPTLTGKFALLEDVWSPQLHNKRDLLVYLPPSYGEDDRRYPVIYMHDGQNLFDENLSFSGEWRVDETVEWLSSWGGETIVVGIPNLAERRLSECCPFEGAEESESYGEEYLAFVVETVKPLIDGQFPTLPSREHTGMIGSSMGGLITLYAFFHYPEIFGFVGSLSPALWYANEAIFPYVEAAPFVPGRIYMDVGTEETPGTIENTRRMVELLVHKGYKIDEALVYIEEPGAEHTESAWAGRFQYALRFLHPNLPNDLPTASG